MYIGRKVSVHYFLVYIVPYFWDFFMSIKPSMHHIGTLTVNKTTSLTIQKQKLGDLNMS